MHKMCKRFKKQGGSETKVFNKTKQYMYVEVP
jgi:hypothetical protein